MAISKQITYSKLFLKQYKTLIQTYPNLRSRIEQRIDLFIVNKSHYLLKNHALTGKKNAVFAFSITGDIRIIYTEFDDCYVFTMIGSHNRVY